MKRREAARVENPTTLNSGFEKEVDCYGEDGCDFYQAGFGFVSGARRFGYYLKLVKVNKWRLRVLTANRI